MCLKIAFLPKHGSIVQPIDSVRLPGLPSPHSKPMTRITGLEVKEEIAKGILFRSERQVDHKVVRAHNSSHHLKHQQT